MKRISDILTRFAATASLAVLTAACGGDGRPDGPLPAAATSVKVNTAVAGVASRGAVTGGDNTFKVLFWRDAEHLESASADPVLWLLPYLASHAPQPVSFYGVSVYDTSYPYPSYDEPLYATGYSPGSVISYSPDDGYRKLTVGIDDPDMKGRFDFLGCDVWREVFRGNLSDPFSQEKNKLYFRHLASKLKFYADRDRATMEKRQYVRNVQIRDLRMSTDGGVHWTPMHTPAAFEWKTLDPGEFTSAYLKVINAARSVAGNEAAASTFPKAGYVTTESEKFAGEGSGYLLARGNTDLVPIRGYDIDSCFVCNPISGGIVTQNMPIRLKMDIRAEMSYDQSFPEPDNESVTDNLTFIKEWKGVELSAIDKVDESGTIVAGDPVKLFKPGNEYRVYIHFSLTGVSLAAREMPWNYAGIHFVPIVGGDLK